MIFSRPAKAPPQMNSTFVVSIWMNSWCGCLRPPCGGTEARGALQDLQQGLLHALARHVAGDRRVLALARDLVDLVDVDDPGLGLLDVVVGGLDQLEQDVLDVLADVAGLGERRWRRRSRTARSACGRASGRGASCRSRSGRAGGCWTSPARGVLAALGAAVLADLDPLVVVVDGDREDLLGRVPGRPRSR